MIGSIPKGVGVLLLPPEPNAPVDVVLHLSTHFGDQMVLLRKGLQEQDAQALQTRLASGGIEDQLRRAILWAASCLASAEPESQATGKEILELIDTLER